MHDKKIMNAPSEISTSAILKFKEIKGHGIQSITYPNISLSRKFDNAPPIMTAKPIRVDFLIFKNMHTKITAAQTSPERAKASPGALRIIPKAAPGL